MICWNARSSWSHVNPPEKHLVEHFQLPRNRVILFYAVSVFGTATPRPHAGSGKTINLGHQAFRSGPRSRWAGGSDCDFGLRYGEFGTALLRWKWTRRDSVGGPKSKRDPIPQDSYPGQKTATLWDAKCLW